MFRALLETSGSGSGGSAPDPAEAEGAVPAPRPPAKPAPKLRPGVPRWLARSSLISFGRQRQLREEREAQGDKLAEALRPSTQLCASRVMSHEADDTAARSGGQRTIMMQGEIVDVGRTGRDHHHKHADVDRAVLSHVRGQAEGLCAFLSRPEARTAWSTSVIDEASMWVRKPPELEAFYVEYPCERNIIT